MFIDDWNKLDSNIRLAENLNNFKEKFKMFNLSVTLSKGFN